MNHTIQAAGFPTLHKLIRIMLIQRTDRAALVRAATPVREAGLAVVLIGANAIREIAPILLEAHRKFFDSDEMDLPALPDFTLDSDLDDTFNRMAAQRKTHLMGIGDKQPLSTSLYLSQEISEWLAPRLTEKGCPCSLA